MPMQKWYFVILSAIVLISIMLKCKENYVCQSTDLSTWSGVANLFEAIFTQLAALIRKFTHMVMVLLAHMTLTKLNRQPLKTRKAHRIFGLFSREIGCTWNSWLIRLFCHWDRIRYYWRQLLWHLWRWHKWWMKSGWEWTNKEDVICKWNKRWWKMSCYVEVFDFFSMARSTWNRRLAIGHVCTPSAWSSRWLLTRNGSMFTWVPSGMKLSMSNPLSAITESPRSRSENTPDRLVISIQRW